MEVRQKTFRDKKIKKQKKTFKTKTILRDKRYFNTIQEKEQYFQTKINQQTEKNFHLTGECRVDISTTKKTPTLGLHRIAKLLGNENKMNRSSQSSSGLSKILLAPPIPLIREIGAHIWDSKKSKHRQDLAKKSDMMSQ